MFSITFGKGTQSVLSKRRVYHDSPTEADVPKIGLDSYNAIAKALQVPPQNVRAISIIESAEKPLTVGGNPVVRFEAHVWARYRLAWKDAMQFDKAKNSSDLDERWTQFEAMHRVDPVAAVKSHSFGWPQIMGFNHKACGCETTDTFLDLMKTIEGQSKCFAAFVRDSPRLHTALQNSDAQKVALHYNGKNFDVNRYDKKFAALSQRSLMA